MKNRLIVLCAMSGMATALVTGCRSTGAATEGESTAWGAQAGRPHVTVTMNQPTAATEATPIQTVDQGTIELRKEEMVVGKRQVSNGGVLLRTIVQTETVSKPVELNREEYVIERIPASEAANLSADNAYVFKGQEIYVPLMREEAVAGKRTVLSEKVQVAKKIETDTATVSHPVRTESVEIVKIAGTAPAAPISLEAGPVTGTPTALNTDSVTLTREDLVVGKKQVDNGGVRLRKVITTQEASQPVQLTREEYTITRTPLAGQTTEDTSFAPREIKMDLTRQEAVAGTKSYLTEVVRVRKQIHTDNQVVSGTLRKESFEVVRTPGSEETLGAATSPSGRGTGSATSQPAATPGATGTAVETGND